MFRVSGCSCCGDWQIWRLERARCKSEKPNGQCRLRQGQRTSRDEGAMQDPLDSHPSSSTRTRSSSGMLERLLRPLGQACRQHSVLLLQMRSSSARRLRLSMRPMTSHYSGSIFKAELLHINGQGNLVNHKGLSALAISGLMSFPEHPGLLRTTM